MKKNTRTPSLIQGFLVLTLVAFLTTFQYMALTGSNEGRRSLRSVKAAKDDYSLRSSSLPTRSLPMLDKTGGLIVFLHVAKTGGTTIRKDFSHFPGVEVKRVFGEGQLQKSKASIDWHLSSQNDGKTNEREQVMLLEIHGDHGEPMTMFGIHPHLQRWRAQAKKSGKKLFVFTLLREPGSFHVSYFNFFRNPDCKYSWCEQPTMPITEENLLKTFVPNHQCQYLARKYNNKQNEIVPVTELECKAVYELMKADLDWVGTTESMKHTTLPLLSYMLTGNPKASTSDVPKNHQKSLLSLRDVSDAAIQRIRTASSFDQSLYASVQKDYKLSMWDNYHLTLEK